MVEVVDTATPRRRASVTHLLIDSVPVGSPGILQVRDELTRTVAMKAPAGSKVLLLATSKPAGLTTSENLTVVIHRKPKWGWMGRWWWYNRTLPRISRQHAADVVYSLSGVFSPRAARATASVMNVNNMVPFTPEQTSQVPLWSVARIRNILLRRLYVQALRRADAVVLHSQHALRMVTRYTGDISRKTFVVLTGVPRDLDPLAAAASPHPNDVRPYFLYLSTFHPYKNHLRLIDAYVKSLTDAPELPDLLLAGIPSDRPYFKCVLKRIAETGQQSRIRYIGILDRSQIPRWIYHATGNVFASTCETNPVTIAEILALRAVLACSSVAPMPEIARDAAIYFDPFSIDSIASAILNLFHDPARRAALRELGRQRAERLSWDECAEQVWMAVEAGRVAYLRRKLKRVPRA